MTTWYRLARARYLVGWRLHRQPPMNFFPVTLGRTGGFVSGAGGGELRETIGEHSFPAPAELGDFAGQSVLAGIRGEYVTASADRAEGAIADTVNVRWFTADTGQELIRTVGIARSLDW